MLKGGGEKLVKLVIVGVKRIYLVVKIVFKLIHIIFFFVEIIQAFLDVLKLSQMLLVLHIVYAQQTYPSNINKLVLFISDAITQNKIKV